MSTYRFLRRAFFRVAFLPPAFFRRAFFFEAFLRAAIVGFTPLIGLLDRPRAVCPRFPRGDESLRAVTQNLTAGWFASYRSPRHTT